jgi:hypothetical protein
MRERGGWAGWQAADAAAGDRAAADRLAVLISQGSGNMLAPAGWEVLALCDHLCGDLQSSHFSRARGSIAEDTRS